VWGGNGGGGGRGGGKKERKGVGNALMRLRIKKGIPEGGRKLGLGRARYNFVFLAEEKEGHERRIIHKKKKLGARKPPESPLNQKKKGTGTWPHKGEGGGKKKRTLSSTDGAIRAKGKKWGM